MAGCLQLRGYIYRGGGQNEHQVGRQKPRGEKNAGEEVARGGGGGPRWEIV